MDFSAKLKGNLTENICATILENAGYRVTNFGIEKTLKEVSFLEQEKYFALGLPDTLRLMPDLIVAEFDMSAVWLLEVKYRQNFDSFKNCASLYEKLQRQAKAWGDFWVLIFLNEPATETEERKVQREMIAPPDSSPIFYPGDFCGVLKIGLSKSNELKFYAKNKAKQVEWKYLNWSNVSRIGAVFKRLEAKAYKNSPIEKSIRIIRELNKLT